MPFAATSPQLGIKAYATIVQLFMQASRIQTEVFILVLQTVTLLNLKLIFLIVLVKSVSLYIKLCAVSTLSSREGILFLCFVGLDKTFKKCYTT